MQQEPKLSEPYVPYTKNIRFWSQGKMAKSAYQRMAELKSKDREDDARVILDEWII